MSETLIWHNPRCSKSRATLALLEARGIAPRIRRYLDDPPTEAELTEALRLLGRPAIDLVRTGEPEFRTAGLTRQSGEAEIVAALARAPKLIERPVVFHAGRAALGRPPEAVLTLL